MENCDRRILCQEEGCKKCFTKSFASKKQSRYWLYENNFYAKKTKPGLYEIKYVSPREVFKNSRKKFWFRCPVSDCHVFEASLYCINEKRFCPFCGNKKLCGNLNCTLCESKSFLSHEKSDQWDYENNKKSPREVFKASNLRYWFICKKCNHSFETKLGNIVYNNQFCPFCSNQKLCSSENCSLCFEKSFQSSKYLLWWDYMKNKNRPREVFKNSTRKAYFVCCKCKHSFEALICNINKGRCVYCGNKKLCSEECSLCYEKSFSSVKNSAYWDLKNNKISQRQVFKKSHEKFWFICPRGHSFKTSPCIISIGCFCPFCKNKTEKIFMEEIKKKKIKYVYQAKFEWCKNKKTKKHLPFDFLLPKFNIIIEIDGPQHFKQVSNWRSPDVQFELDVYKARMAFNNGYTLIRILQKEFVNDPEKVIEKLKELFYLRKIPEFIFIGKEYTKYKLVLDEEGKLDVDKMGRIARMVEGIPV